MSRLALAVLFIVAGSLHFAFPHPYRVIIPPYLPHPAALVAMSGVAEILGGVGLLLEGTRAAAAICLAVLLAAVMPANTYMATAHINFGVVPQWALWLRIPLQIPLILWALRFVRHR